MIIKPRFESVELKILKYLHSRMNLPVKEEQHSINLKKGFQGEQKFDVWLMSMTIDKLILNDLLLESNNTVFQIDTLLICQDHLYNFEVKNYEGDFYIEDDRWYTI
ncbi:nuclease-related domain-containing protein [Lederbergia citrea]|uniref:nuclease-related domain-containing protein n=1 Tax=Lederbergia citrea TaxID=2833581 RepID=UPI002016717B|nr:nuclease-related domain-containing protein [Lederbergia citrea]